jgi:hypothetical protein
VAAVSDEYVRGLDVAVNDSVRVSGIQTLCNLDSQVQDLVRAKRFAEDALPQRLALQILHGNEVLPLKLVDVVDRAYIGMIQCRSRLCLASEALQSVLVLGQLFWQKLQGDGALKLGVLGLIDNTHSASAELFDDTVVGDAFADHGEFLQWHFAHCKNEDLN